MKDITYTDIVSAIVGGQLDEYLPRINQIAVGRIKQVRNQKGREIMASLKVGDKVRFVESVKPRLLAGAVARVTGFKTKKIVVDLLFRQGRWGNGISVPPQLLVKH